MEKRALDAFGQLHPTLCSPCGWAGWGAIVCQPHSGSFWPEGRGFHTPTHCPRGLLLVVN